MFADFVENYISSRKDVKPGTVKTWGGASQKVQQFFSRRTIKSLTVKTEGLPAMAQNTPTEDGGREHKGRNAVQTSRARESFLNEAVNAEIISANPFRAIKARRTRNRDGAGTTGC
ncbi:MAG: hypothetical protein R3C49_19725 [Planctomycetaceae bacterium]